MQKTVKPKQSKSTIGGSKSSLAVATALTKHFPAQAKEIVKIMADAATSRSMRRKLERVQLSLESLRKGAQ
jgi:hypothetical protein